MTPQTYCVGFGAGKSGSTWLYSYLRTHPECRMSVLKEMSYFNTIESDNPGRLFCRIREGRDNAAKFRASGAGHVNGYGFDEQRILLDDYEALAKANRIDVPGYLEILRRHAQDARVFGEVTPGYAVLSGGALRRIYDAFPRTRFIYLMRDPLQRLWSHARMIAKGCTGAEKQIAVREVAATIVGIRPHLAAISDYAGTIERLEAAAPRAHIHYEFSEVLFSGRAAAGAARNRICDFLEIQHHCPERVDEVVNGGIRIDLPLGLGRAALSWLRPHYDFVRRKFGALPPAWEVSLAKYGEDDSAVD